MTTKPTPREQEKYAESPAYQPEEHPRMSNTNQSKEEGSFSGGAKSLQRDHLVALLRAARRWVEEGGTISGYGFYRPENPHDFHPDPESCTEEEIANHRAACEAWDRGDYKREPGSIHMASEDGSTVMHITRAPWGIGSYTDMQDEAADLLAAIDCTLAEHAALSSQSEPLRWPEGAVFTDLEGGFYDENAEPLGNSSQSKEEGSFSGGVPLRLALRALLGIAAGKDFQENYRTVRVFIEEALSSQSEAR